MDKESILPVSMIVLYIVIMGVLLIGEVKCIIKAVNCNWAPIGKAEVVYTGAALTGLGCIIGWIEIKDN